MSQGNFRCLLVSGHCPHTAHPAERAEFLEDLGRRLKPYMAVQVVILGLDLNGRPSTLVDNVTGARACGLEDETGRQAVQVLADLGMWMPSTYDEYHSGADETYCHPTGKRHRIDFVCIGGAATPLAVHSRVNPEIDTGCPREDHSVVQLDLHGMCGRVFGARKLWRPRFDCRKISSPEGRAILECEFQGYDHPDWKQHVDLHCQHLQDFVIEILERHFPLPQQGLRASYIPDWVWELRRAKLRLKQVAQHRRHLWRAQVQEAFKAWKDPCTGSLAANLAKDSLLYQLASTAIGLTTVTIKKAIYAAKAEYLRTLVSDGTNASQILRQAKKAGIGGRKSRPVVRPAPKLLNTEGRDTTCRQERDDLWLQHFGAMELGEKMAIQDFLREPSHRQQPAEDAQWRYEDLINLTDIERVCRRTSSGKASGLDAIPGEVLRSAPVAAARLLQPLFLKSLRNYAQPVQWRGGILYPAWKQSGPVSEPSSHRSLFVSSQVGKVLHRALRDKAQQHFGSVLHDMHFGLRKGAPVTLGALYIASHMRSGGKEGNSACTLFLDMRSAYYRAIREIATGAIRADDMALRIMRKFDLDDEEIHELMGVIHAGGALRDSGISPALCASAADLHSRTWFVSAQCGGGYLSTTMAGSRPGESWADVIFGYIHARVLRRIAEISEAEELCTIHHLDETAGIFGQPHVGAPIMATDTTWADDSAFPLSDVSPDRLLRKAKRLGSIVISSCQAYGMAPNTKRGKTSYLFDLRGKGLNAAKKAHFSNGKSELLLADLDMIIPIVPVYTHLGGVLDGRMSMKDETKRRLSIARGSFDAGKWLLYQNKTIPLRVRASLFTSAILPTFFNIGLWEPIGEQWQKLCGGYSRLLRRILQPQFGPHDTLRIPTPVVHLLTGCWTLDLEATKARLGLLCSLVAVNPAPLWAVLQSEQTWLRAIQQDLQLIVSYGGEWPALRPANWPQWWHLIRGDAVAFKRRVKKALQKAHEQTIKDGAIQAGLWAMFRQAVRRRPNLGLIEVSWYCRPCKQAFGSKRGLGVHLFKRHGRKAQYRLYAVGTLCRACGKQLWAQSRLYIHLRDSPKCVQTLRHHGLGAATAPPGKGSRAWKKQADEEYTLALPQPACEPLQPWQAGQWDDVQLAAYADLCQVLFGEQEWESAEALLELIEATLACFPLYRTEEGEVLRYIAEEVRLLRADDPEYPWASVTYDVILDTLGKVEEKPIYIEKPEEDEVSEAISFRRFATVVSQGEWNKIHQASPSSCGTHAQSFVLLDAGWEAERPVFSDDCDFSATISSALLCVPKPIRLMWEQVIQGRVSTIQAPVSFWQSPFAAPFAALRDLSHA